MRRVLLFIGIPTILLLFLSVGWLCRPTLGTQYTDLFSQLKLHEARSLTSGQTTAPRAIESFFRSAANFPRLNLNRQFDRVCAIHGWAYERPPNSLTKTSNWLKRQTNSTTPPTPKKYLPAFAGPVKETFHAIESCQEWNNDRLMTNYMETVYETIPEGAVFLPHSDDGRFLVTMYHDLQPAPRFTIVSPPMLTEDSYLKLMRTRYPDLTTPGPGSLQPAMKNAQRTFISSRTPSQRPSLRTYDLLGGAIAELTQHTITNNPAIQHWYVEGSYLQSSRVLEQCTPEGLLLKYHLDPITTEDLVTSHTYWEQMIDELLADQEFSTNEYAQGVYADARILQARVYECRGELRAAINALDQAYRLKIKQPRPLYQKGLILANLNQSEEAFQWIDHMKEEHPEAMERLERLRMSIIRYENQKRVYRAKKAQQKSP